MSESDKSGKPELKARLREPTKPELLDISFRLMGFQFSPKMTDLIYETVTLLNKKGGNLDMLDTAKMQAANEYKFLPPSKKYAHMKGKRHKPANYTLLP